MAICIFEQIRWLLSDVNNISSRITRQPLCPVTNKPSRGWIKLLWLSRVSWTLMWWCLGCLSTATRCTCPLPSCSILQRCVFSLFFSDVEAHVCVLVFVPAVGVSTCSPCSWPAQLTRFNCGHAASNHPPAEPHSWRLGAVHVSQTPRVL